MTEREELLQLLEEDQREELLSFVRDEEPTRKLSICVECLLPFPRWGRSPRCPECNRHRCSKCGGDKSPFMPHRWCPTCLQEKAKQQYQGTNRYCRDCREPLPDTRRDTLCYLCRKQHSLYQEEKAKRVKPSRPCSQCETMMEAGRRLSFCHSCYLKRQRLSRASRSRSCPLCQKTIKATRSICNECSRDERKIERREPITLDEIKQTVEAGERRRKRQRRT